MTHASTFRPSRRRGVPLPSRSVKRPEDTITLRLWGEEVSPRSRSGWGECVLELGGPEMDLVGDRDLDLALVLEQPLGVNDRDADQLV